MPCADPSSWGCGQFELLSTSPTSDEEGPEPIGLPVFGFSIIRSRPREILSGERMLRQDEPEELAPPRVAAAERP